MQSNVRGCREWWIPSSPSWIQPSPPLKTATWSRCLTKVASLSKTLNIQVISPPHCCCVAGGTTAWSLTPPGSGKSTFLQYSGSSTDLHNPNLGSATDHYNLPLVRACTWTFVCCLHQLSHYMWGAIYRGCLHLLDVGGNWSTCRFCGGVRQLHHPCISSYPCIALTIRAPNNKLYLTWYPVLNHTYHFSC